MNKLTVLCHAIHGDDSIDAYIGPDTTEVRAAISKLDEEHGPGMFEIADPNKDPLENAEAAAECDTPNSLIESLSWWANDCDDTIDHEKIAKKLLTRQTATSTRP